MSFWSVDLSKWGDLIRKWFPVARELAQHGATMFGDLHVKVESVGLPTSRDDLVSVPVTLVVSVKQEMLADLVQLKAVKVHGNLSAKLPVLSWPEVSTNAGSLHVYWPVGTRPLINIPAIDPLVANIDLHPDGTGEIEIQRGPDGTITY